MSKATVLLVEDSKIQKLANERTLHKAGYIVLNASDGEEALRTAHEKIPDLILLDMLLPKLGGPEVLRALKQDPATVRIPVIVLSSLPQTNELKVRLDGADGYFEKSRLFADVFGEREFVDSVEKVIREAKDRREAAAQTDSLALAAKAGKA